MKEPRWLPIAAAFAIHADQITIHGGAPGLNDRGLLESALDRPRNRFHYEPGSDLCRLAAAYGFGIAKNHPFNDGNKRVTFQMMYTFLGLNGLSIDAQEEEVVSLMRAVAGGETGEMELASWLRDHTVAR